MKQALVVRNGWRGLCFLFRFDRKELPSTRNATRSADVQYVFVFYFTPIPRSLARSSTLK